MTASRRRVTEDAWGALLRVHASLVPKIDRHLRTSVGMPLSWYDALLELAAAPEGRLRMGELADRAVLSRARISRVVDELVAADLVTKETNPEDKRSSYAAITSSGRSLQRRAAPAYLAQIDSLFGKHLTVDELRDLADALSRVVRSTQDQAPRR